MRLVGNGSRLELRVIEYEYPDSKEIDDANWLVIGIDVVDKNGISWSAKESCLRTFELVLLRDWFISIRNNETSSMNISFTENELALHYEPKRILDIVLDFKFHPKGDNYNYYTDSGYVIRFSLDENQLIKSLNYYIDKFPEKIGK